MVSAEQMHRITTMSKEVGKSKLETAFELNLADRKEKYLIFCLRHILWIS